MKFFVGKCQTQDLSFKNSAPPANLLYTPVMKN